jgi:sorbitol-specific phosphotransferase system component IIC
MKLKANKVLALLADEELMCMMLGYKTIQKCATNPLRKYTVLFIIIGFFLCKKFPISI